MGRGKNIVTGERNCKDSKGTAGVKCSQDRSRVTGSAKAAFYSVVCFFSVVHAKSSIGRKLELFFTVSYKQRSVRRRLWRRVSVRNPN